MCTVQEGSTRFAALVESDRDDILSSFRDCLAKANNPLITETCARLHLMTFGTHILTDVAMSVRTGTVQTSPGYRNACVELGEALARSYLYLTPSDALAAAVIFFNVTVDSLTEYVRSDPALLACFVTAILAVNESTTLRIREVTHAYTESLLRRVERAQLEERRRVARDLHDRIGEGLSVALRRLELEEMTQLGEVGEASLPALIGKNALTEAMQRLRLVISDLRQDQVLGLKKALACYVHGIDDEVDVRLRVRGEEHWASSHVIDETYLIMREALRNAVTHGAPQTLDINVELSRNQLRACVKDDGRGFAVDAVDAAEAGKAAGLASMRERAAMLGGELKVTSASQCGTMVELLVPLTGDRDE